MGVESSNCDRVSLSEKCKVGRACLSGTTLALTCERDGRHADRIIHHGI